MLSRNAYLSAIPAESYVDKDVPVLSGGNNIIDCALGTNPFGSPEAATAAFAEAACGCRLSSYPDPWGQELKQALAVHWEQAAITVDNIVLGAGSVGILLRLNTLFLAPGSVLAGFAPQFSDYVRTARAWGAEYRPVALVAPELRLSGSRLLDHLSPDVAAVYIDNPHNPTGQVLPISELKQIAARALSQNTAVIVDEAYGDFMMDDNSAINLVHDYPNVAVARSFSKGWGLAGLRVGYGIMNVKLRQLYDKVNLPFSVIDPAAAAACAALTEPGFIVRSRVKIARIKKQIKQCLTCLKMAASDDATPIMTLTGPDTGLNLRQLFLDRGVVVVDGAEFPGLSSASVRLRVPADDAALLTRLRLIERDLVEGLSHVHGPTWL